MTASTHFFDPRGLGPPPPPPLTHRERALDLPSFTLGEGRTRLERGRAYLAEVRRRIEDHHRSGAAGLSTCRLLSEATDRLICGLFNEVVSDFELAGGVSLVALGGYGRRELSPHSDVDLLLLRAPRAREEQVKPLAATLSTLLWDLKLAVGWSVRSLEESALAAEQDHTVRTSLLDSRLVAGDPLLHEQLAQHAVRELWGTRADDFVRDKLRELRGRREKFGDSIFLLEPNLKQGDGGLRDLETALWIAQARFRTRGLAGLLQRSILPASEVATVRAARDFLLRIRHQLHYLRRRKEDRLTFDLQEEVARFLGYQDGDDGLAVEKFMRHYYLSAKAIRRAADQLIAKCEEAQKRPAYPQAERRVGGHFKLFRGMLTLDGGPEVLARNPSLCLRLFRLSEELDVRVYSWAREQVVAHLPQLFEARGEPAVVEEFKALYGRPGTRGERLFELHELGVLGAVVPEFGRVTAHHQHDLYHVYTVDVHTLFAVRRLYALRAGDMVDKVPELSREMADLQDPLPLYLGMLIHDAGKGMGGNHSERGRQLMAQLGERLGLSARQREISEFLVEKHLLMSHLAQRRDLSDDELIAQFADEVRDVERLTCLYLLTYADICSVGPSMWTDWKGQLLKELYDKAKAHLLGEGRSRAGSPEASRAAFARRWTLALGAARSGALLEALPPRYFSSTDPGEATLHARLLARARRQPLVAFLRHRPAQGFTELSLCAQDQPGLLALFAGVLSAHRVDILRARVTSTADGLALDVFDVLAPHNRLLDRRRWRAARADLIRVLGGEAKVEDILKKRRPSPVLVRHLPHVPPKVSVDNRASGRFTVVDVRAEDRVGLLHAISSALKAEGVQIELAKVATEAHRAIDSFYVTKRGKKITDPTEIESLMRQLQGTIDRFEREHKVAPG